MSRMSGGRATVRCDRPAARRPVRSEDPTTSSLAPRVMTPEVPSVDVVSMWDAGALAERPHEVWPAARRRYEAVRAWVAEGEVLDLGSGTGWLTRALRELGTAVVGMDRSPDALRIASAVDGATFVGGSADALPFRSQSFDAIATLEVLEHTEDPTAVLRECHRVLRDEGRLLVTVPNGFGLYGLLIDRPMDLLASHPRVARGLSKVLPSRYLRRQLQVHLDENMRVHHESVFRWSQWADLFAAAGFTLESGVATEILSPLAGLVLRLALPSSHARFLRMMQRVGRLDDWLIPRAPRALASGWAFDLSRR
jgi:2-polyprenyl-3-methyl-5-hydroxy-6-metoxy-1,4-benzoquinol methylase